jgi:hypothetical protein
MIKVDDWLLVSRTIFPIELMNEGDRLGVNLLSQSPSHQGVYILVKE